MPEVPGGTSPRQRARLTQEELPFLAEDLAWLAGWRVAQAGRLCRGWRGVKDSSFGCFGWVLEKKKRLFEAVGFFRRARVLEELKF